MQARMSTRTQVSAVTAAGSNETSASRLHLLSPARVPSPPAKSNLFLSACGDGEREQRPLRDCLGDRGLLAGFERGLRELRHGAREPGRGPAPERGLDRGLAAEVNEGLDPTRCLAD